MHISHFFKVDLLTKMDPLGKWPKLTAAADLEVRDLEYNKWVTRKRDESLDREIVQWDTAFGSRMEVLGKFTSVPPGEYFLVFRVKFGDHFPSNCLMSTQITVVRDQCGKYELPDVDLENCIVAPGKIDYQKWMSLKLGPISVTAALENSTKTIFVKCWSKFRPQHWLGDFFFDYMELQPGLYSALYLFYRLLQINSVFNTYVHTYLPGSKY